MRYLPSLERQEGQLSDVVAENKRDSISEFFVDCALALSVHTTMNDSMMTCVHHHQTRLPQKFG